MMIVVVAASWLMLLTLLARFACTLGIAANTQERGGHGVVVDVGAWGVNVLLSHLQGEQQRHAIEQGWRRPVGG